jgi:hypothetical protein
MEPGLYPFGDLTQTKRNDSMTDPNDQTNADRAKFLTAWDYDFHGTHFSFCAANDGRTDYLFRVEIADGVPHHVGHEILRRISAAPDLLCALERAESFIAGFEGDDAREAIGTLLGQVRLAIAAAKPPTSLAPDVIDEMQDELQAGIEVAQDVIDTWARGNLAAAVNALGEWKKATQAAIDKANIVFCAPDAPKGGDQ